MVQSFTRRYLFRTYGIGLLYPPDGLQIEGLIFLICLITHPSHRGDDHQQRVGLKTLMGRMLRRMKINLNIENKKYLNFQKFLLYFGIKFLNHFRISLYNINYHIFQNSFYKTLLLL